jgi:hypothetical protein
LEIGCFVKPRLLVAVVVLPAGNKRLFYLNGVKQTTMALHVVKSELVVNDAPIFLK